LLESAGEEFKNVQVYTGNVTFVDISYKTGINMYLAYMFSGMIRRMGCRVRPYETLKGRTDEVISRSIAILSEAFRSGLPFEQALDEVITLFEGIETSGAARPRVAIFGDLYVRDNDILNQDLISVIENNGGEVITTPYSELIKIVADPYIKRWFREGDFVWAMTSKIMKQALGLFERRYYPYFNRILNEGVHMGISSYSDVLARFGLDVEHTGESMENILKMFSLVMNYPDLSLFVQ